MERWTFLIIAGPDGSAAQIRVLLRAGDDAAAWPSAQLTLDGTEVPVDEVAHDYEAAEWKAVQLVDGATSGAGQAALDKVKDRLRVSARS
jgi:hypothetical protein